MQTGIARSESTNVFLTLKCIYNKKKELAL